MLWTLGKPDRNGRRSKEMMRCEQASAKYREAQGLSFYRASSTDPETWTTFDEVCRYYDTYSPSGKVRGIGFVLGKLTRDECADLVLDPDGNVHSCGVDLDECLDDGKLKSWAKPIVDGAASYTEVSPSRTGLKTFLFADPTEVIRRRTEVRFGKAEHMEMYHHGRYFCVTGHRSNTFDVNDLTDWYVALHATNGDTSEEPASDSPDGNGFATDDSWKKDLDGVVPDEWWKEYSGDLRTLDVVGLWTEAGLFIETIKTDPATGEVTYRIQCPNHKEHSTDAIEGTVLFKTEGKYSRHRVQTDGVPRQRL